MTAVAYPSPNGASEPRPPTYEEVVADNARLRQQIAALTERDLTEDNRQLKQRNAYLERENSELWRVVRNGKVLAQKRAAYTATLSTLHDMRSAAGSDTFVVDYYQGALKSGMFQRAKSEDPEERREETKRAKERLGRTLRDMHEDGFLFKGKVVTERNGDNEERPIGVEVTLRGNLIQALHELGTRDDKIPKRGERGATISDEHRREVRWRKLKDVEDLVPICPHCGSTHLSATCETCGETTSPIGELEVTQGEKGPPPRSQNLRRRRHATRPSSETDTDREVVSQNLRPRLNQGRENDEEGGSSFEDACSFLVDLAGDAPSHGIMFQTGESKFITCPGCVTKQLAAQHLRGKACLGAYLRIGDRLTRVLVWDADTPERTAILRGAARKLAASGATVALETSPSVQHPGGSHLLLPFEGPVSISAARATALKVAPELAAIEEFWPTPTSGHVRLPAGYYHRPEAKDWCKVLIAGFGEEVTGVEAIRLMMDRQTPVSWVTEPEPPPPPPPRPVSRDEEGAFWTGGAPITRGNRNSGLARIAGGMVRRGASGEQLEHLLVEANQKRCQPPLSESEVRTIARSVEQTACRRQGTRLEPAAYRGAA